MDSDDDVFQKAIKEKIKMQKGKDRKVCLIGVNKLYRMVQKYKKEYNVEYVNKIRNKRDRKDFEMYKKIAEIVNEEDKEKENKSAIGDNGSSSGNVVSTTSTTANENNNDNNVVGDNTSSNVVSTKSTTTTNTNTKNKNKQKDNFYVTSLINTKYFSIDKTENIFFSNNLRSITLSNTDDNPNIYELTFTFNPNNSFTNTSITKTYIINPQTDKVIDIKVTPIEWKEKETELHRASKYSSTESNKQRLIHYLISPQDNPENDAKITKQNELDLALETNNFNFFKKEYLPQLLEYYLNFIPVNDEIETELKQIQLKHKLYK